MAPKKTPKGKSVFFDVRAKPSGNFGVDFSDVGRRWWLGTYPTADEAARAYNMAVWRAGRPKTDLNFPEVESQAVAELLVPQGIRMEEMPVKKAKKRPAVVVAPGESDEAAMARFAREHPQYVQAELEHYWKRDVEAKKKGVKKEDEAGPSTVIPIESSDEDWGDSEEEEEEEEEGCDDPTKDEFWEQFRSSDDEE
ncbi:hypothetical protein VPH35_134936 [Triticum aestivum]